MGLPHVLSVRPHRGYYGGRGPHDRPHQGMVGRVVRLYQCPSRVRVFFVFMSGREVRHVRYLMWRSGQYTTGRGGWWQDHRTIKDVLHRDLCHYFHRAFYYGILYISSSGRKCDSSYAERIIFFWFLVGLPAFSCGAPHHGCLMAPRNFRGGPCYQVGLSYDGWRCHQCGGKWQGYRGPWGPSYRGFSFVFLPLF